MKMMKSGEEEHMKTMKSQDNETSAEEDFENVKQYCSSSFHI
ncbi:MAG: hypothetical protein R6V49_03425 [Bacteroidales bacterium]